LVLAFLGSVSELNAVIVNGCVDSGGLINGPIPLAIQKNQGGAGMSTELINQTTVPKLICHFCGIAKPAYETVVRGHSRLCHECLMKHPIDILVKGTKETENLVETITPE